MSAHLALRSGNPALTADTFTSIPRTSSENAMTISGTVNKTALALAILFVAATYVWSQGAAGALPTGFIILGQRDVISLAHDEYGYRVLHGSFIIDDQNGLPHI